MIGRHLVLAGLLTACSPAAEKPSPMPEAPNPPVAQAAMTEAVYRGAAIAGQVCSQCHDVGQGTAPTLQIGAPAFRAIAAQTETTPEELAGWMAANHPKMPNYLFPEGQVTDLAAYIISLRDRTR